MPFVVDNLRLRDLVAIVRQNQRFYDEFVRFLEQAGYKDVYMFINEQNDQKAKEVLENYLKCQPEEKFYDGAGRPYSDAKAKWYFLAWILRDAPVQRLEPLLRAVPGLSLEKRKAELLNQLRKFVGLLLPEAERWSWPVLSEVMLARLEGSRRALRGARIEEIVRSLLRQVFASHNLALRVGEGQISLDEETYDVQVYSGSTVILMPVKTRETMGGGHANLFTRDISEAINTAHTNGYACIPVIIAESWAGNLDALGCRHIISLQANPNQTEMIEISLREEFEKLLPVWQEFAGAQDGRDSEPPIHR